MARAILRTFRDLRVGRFDLELAPAGVLLVIAFGDPYGLGIGVGPSRSRPKSWVGSGRAAPAERRQE